VTALGPHVRVVESSFTSVHGLEPVERHARAADVVVNAAARMISRCIRRSSRASGSAWRRTDGRAARSCT